VLFCSEIDDYVDSIFSHLAPFMGTWHSEQTVRTELSRIKATLRHLFPPDEVDDPDEPDEPVESQLGETTDISEDLSIDFRELTWKDWLQAFERLGKHSTRSYGNLVARFLSLHDPRLAIPVKNAANYHLAELTGQTPQPLHKIPQPLFPQQEFPAGTPLSPSPTRRRAESVTQRKIIALDELLQSLTEDSEEDSPQKPTENGQAEIPSSPFDRLRRLLRRKG
jgi:hypothetical protein